MEDELYQKELNMPKTRTKQRQLKQTLTDRQRQRFEKLLTDVENTSFACGEWDRNEHEESFDVYVRRSYKAKRLLREFICGKQTARTEVSNG